ncbi:MAG: hypothetical protein GF344_01085 [Chitinivibrionales bacterium]|nr:hypothetical protein [Chitinivibrionales bacterium]MBD3355695.1 hypothetical protein [Chitinivibrionales bacterium]
MPRPKVVRKAMLQACKWDRDGNLESLVGDPAIVQFNPETLKLTTTNQIANDNNRGGAALQFSSRGTTKLAFELWFDVSARMRDGRAEEDVRTYTAKVATFMKTERRGSGQEVKYIPPGCLFLWGRMLFFGVMESMNENLEYFSDQGVPLRANVSVSLTKQDVQVRNAENGGAGTRRVRPLPQGGSLQDMFGEQWQRQALANDIDDPNRMRAGTPIQA